jgi:superoxide dismutase, Fe-Mn family
MFGPGFVWLVRVGPSDFRLLTTYLAGSPYPGAHWRRQGSDMNTLGHDGSARNYFKNLEEGRRRKGPGNDLPPGGIQLEPLLCLNTWEHAWLLDWGVGLEGRGGKMAFAESWWELIDWEQVSNKAGTLAPEYAAPASE